MNASMEERKNWRFIASGEGVHWNQLDEDISIKNLILDNHLGKVKNHLSDG
jgi:hypothetical protein